jgi:hypothetical protein
LCHKQKYLLLTTLISGPQQPDIDIDVFRTIDGGNVEALKTWDQCMRWVQQTTLQSKS